VFTTGQVLTAAQMTSLQATAMGGGAASTKTASYSLLSTDAGTTVAMNAAGATTITVDTGLFAAGDTVFIQNVGAGVCTITAGTATVDTAGALALPQYDAGILYFTSASAAIFYDYIQVGAASPLTTKGDLYTFGTSDTRLPVGTDGYTLVADSSTATGLAYAAPAGGGSTYTLISTTSLSGTSTTVSGLTSNKLKIVIIGQKDGSGAGDVKFHFNGVTGGTDYTYEYSICNASSFVNVAVTDGTPGNLKFAPNNDGSVNTAGAIYIDGANGTSIKQGYFQSSSKDGAASLNQLTIGNFIYASTTPLTSFTLTSSTTMTAGSIRIYGA
jgi:hypothetical protein